MLKGPANCNFKNIAQGHGSYIKSSVISAKAVSNMYIKK